MAIDTGGARALAVLQSACQTLLSTSPNVVLALSISISAHEAGGTIEDWKAAARELADANKLCVEVSVPRRDLHVRFSRPSNGKQAR